MALEIARRWVGGRWRTGSVDEPDSGGGGLPSGGSTGEVLTKESNADGDVGWEPSGGSPPGTPTVIGPYPVDFTDFPDPDDTLDLFTLPVGTAILTWWADPDTYVTWEEDLALGQGTGWTYDPNGPPFGTGVLGQVGHGSDPQAPDGEAMAFAEAWKYRYSAAGVASFSSFAAISTAGPVQAKRVTVDGIADGHSDLYFLIATPTLILPS